jgi:porin
MDRMVPGRARTGFLVVGAVLLGIGDGRAASLLRRGTAERCEREKMPGEFPEHRFRSPFPSLAKERQELRDKYLLGDLLGARSTLVDHGINLTFLLITDPFGNVLGGQRLGFADYGLVGADLVIDTGKLVGWCGAQFHVGFADNFGSSLSQAYVGNSFPIQLADVADTHVRLTYLSYTQSLFDGRLSIRLGRLTLNSVTGEEFLASEYFKAFTSVAINLVPLGLFLNAPGAFGYPDATWGARVKVEPIQQLYVMAGVYNGDPSLKSGLRHGVDFSFRGPPFLIAEIGLRRNYGNEARGLSGNLKLGAYEDDGRYGFYLVGDHELLRWGSPKQHRHLGAFGSFVYTLKWNDTPMPIFLDGGLVLYGPASRRSKDFVGVAVAYGSYSTSTGGVGRSAILIPPNAVGNVPDFEMTIEGTYGLRLLPGFVLQPDIQYIIHPSGKSSIPNALALGVNVVVTP